jgi:hypothetical protein
MVAVVSSATTFTTTDTIQYDTITSSGHYRLTLDGAQGGGAQSAGGGAGAQVNGDIYLAQGTVLEIVVGEAGRNAAFDAGGGGGSFVFEVDTGAGPGGATVDQILAAAGGGGGGGSYGNGGGGVPTPNGANGDGSAAAGGAGGAGGANGAAGAGFSLGGGGGGYTGGAGGGISKPAQSGSVAGTKFTGGSGTSGGGGDGGFGGGGGGGTYGAGGGGGYGGGGGGHGPGGGGGSYVADLTATSETGGTHTGNGLVILDQLDNLACFCTGTLILTPRGAVAVEDLAAGDVVITVREGGKLTQRIIWTGKRSLDIARHATPEQVRPIRVKASAFGQGVPERDLRLSPHHAVYVDGQFVEIFRLVNGLSIIRETATRHVTYHHIELETHDVILSEGLPSESFLDTGNRDMFEGEAAIQLHPAFTRLADADFCAPMLREGVALAALHARLRRHAQNLSWNVA